MKYCCLYESFLFAAGHNFCLAIQNDDTNINLNDTFLFMAI